MKLSHVYFVVYLSVYLLMFIQKLKTSVIHSAVQNSGHNYARSICLIWWFVSFWLVIGLTSIKIKILRKMLGAPEGWPVLAVWGIAVRVTLWFVNSVRTMQRRTPKLTKHVAFFVRGKKCWRFIWRRILMEDSERAWKMDLNENSLTL